MEYNITKAKEWLDKVTVENISKSTNIDRVMLQIENGSKLLGSLGTNPLTIDIDARIKKLNERHADLTAFNVVQDKKQQDSFKPLPENNTANNTANQQVEQMPDQKNAEIKTDKKIETKKNNKRKNALKVSLGLAAALGGSAAWFLSRNAFKSLPLLDHMVDYLKEHGSDGLTFK